MGKVKKRNKSKKKKIYSKKKQKQYDKKIKLSKKNISKTNLDEKNNMNKYYITLALLNLSQILYSQGDLTWGGIVNPLTYQVDVDYWPGTNIKISELDKSRINAVSLTSFTGDSTWNYDMFYGGKKSNSRGNIKK